MRKCIFGAVLLLTAPAVAMAQPAAPSAGGVVAPQPEPLATPGDGATDYLRLAQSAVAAGRIADAQEALARAETRMLDRSTPLGQTNIPSDNPTVGQIVQAEQALAARDRAGALQLIQAAIASATAQGF